MDELLRAAAGADPVLIYKHSPRCVVSLFAAWAVRSFARRRPGIPVFQVDVVAERRLSDALAEALGVAHASPQVIWLEDGQATWTASHDEIRCRRLIAQADRSASR